MRKQKKKLKLGIKIFISFIIITIIGGCSLLGDEKDLKDDNTSNQIEKPKEEEQQKKSTMKQV